MRSSSISRRTLLLLAAAIPPGLGFDTAVALATDARDAAADTRQEITRNAVAIHQEITFHASRRRVYHALTDAKAFDRVVQLSAAVTSAMVPATAAPSQIGRRAGAAFSLFGGYVSGLQVELVPDRRIVQVWRAGSWNPGEYSLASFVLADEAVGCRLVFDHRGFPAGEVKHLAEGWHGNYWKPLAQALAQA
jgi:activator of HSP90 ATPase